LDARRVDELFAEAVALGPTERLEFLDRNCRGEDAVRREVEALLDAVQEGERVLGESVSDFAADLLGELASALRDEESPLLEGAAVGPWRVTGELGRGGMGVVYLAERADGAFARQVAIKVVKRGMDTDDILRRFRHEREILAGLEHPNIARLIDAGVTDDGRPFLVMERVVGCPIDRFCDEERLDVRARLRLFRDVCQAVAYAHGHLVVHRDLKPSNILVDSDGCVRLLDFGIAKLLTESAHPDRPVTRAGVSILTPEFAAPEQMAGRGVVTTAADVYALGVVLHRLLTGCSPDRGAGGDRGTSTAGMEPVPPSEMLARRRRKRDGPHVGSEMDLGDDTARLRGTTTGGLCRLLRGDLDRIVLRALQPDPERRYGSVTELDEDLRRHLAGEPIIARRSEKFYRLGRFVRRHRSVVFAGAAAAIALSLYVATLAVSRASIERERATAALEARNAAAVTEFMVSLFLDEGISGASADELTARELLHRGAARVRDGRGLDLSARGATLLALGQAFRGLGDIDHALSLLSDAVASRRLEGAGPERISEAVAALASARMEARHFREADSLYAEALQIYAAAQDPDSLVIARWLGARGGALRDLGAPDSSVALVQRSLELRTRLGGPGDPALAGALSDLGYTLRGLGRIEESEVAYRRSLEIERGAVEPRGSVLARTLNNLGVLLREEGRADEAEAAFREAVDLARASLGPDHGRTTVKEMHLAQMLERRGASEEAEALLRGQVETLVERWGLGHWTVGQAWFRLGDLVRDHRLDVPGSAPHYAEAVRIFVDALGPDHAWTGSARRSLGYALGWAGRFEEAESELSEAVRILRFAHGDDDHEAVRGAREQLALLREARDRSGRTPLGNRPGPPAGS